eukprot:CAMPEP_0197033678 /NCGR_PEP_ID=MMETSP1384-20130603/12022_1 /TAXON_ID=29189 /ORGANISM="Ammonia sp." /LENGTH=333 /DNA_ID=CAMNT_0042463519 /DNA_START=26 /DNA_END=1027 /DNA_ORIENTATION=-
MSVASKVSTDYDAVAICDLHRAGFTKCTKISNTLQGGIWSALHHVYSQRRVVIKVCNKQLHHKARSIVNGVEYQVYENILKEASNLKYLTHSKTKKKCTRYITKYKGFFESSLNYYLVMQHGGKGLFEFVVKAHQLICDGRIRMAEWHKTVQIIFKQMIESIEYIHSLNVSHFDVSLENYLINDISIIPVNGDQCINFVGHDIRIKLCDFGLSEKFESKISSNFYSNKYVGKEVYKSPEINHRHKFFDAKKNDIWCAGVCLFAMITGAFPWQKAWSKDAAFVKIMNAEYAELFTAIKRAQYVNKQIIDLFRAIFQYEEKRISLQEMKQHAWLT